MGTIHRCRVLGSLGSARTSAPQARDTPANHRTEL